MASQLEEYLIQLSTKLRKSQHFQFYLYLNLNLNPVNHKIQINPISQRALSSQHFQGLLQNYNNPFANIKEMRELQKDCTKKQSTQITKRRPFTLSCLPLLCCSSESGGQQIYFFKACLATLIVILIFLSFHFFCSTRPIELTVCTHEWIMDRPLCFFNKIIIFKFLFRK